MSEKTDPADLPSMIDWSKVLVCRAMSPFATKQLCGCPPDDCARDRSFTPTPVETTDPTAGEREHIIEERGRVYDRCRCGWYGSLGDTHVSENTPAEPDAGDVEACPVKWCVYPMPHGHTEGSGPTFDALLADPEQQLDHEGVVLASILSHQNAEPRRLTTAEREWLDDSMLGGFDNLILTVERLMERAADEVRPTAAWLDAVRRKAVDMEALARTLRPVTFDLGSRGPTEMVPLSDVVVLLDAVRRKAGEPHRHRMGEPCFSSCPGWATPAPGGRGYAAEPDPVSQPADVEALMATAEALCRADESWEHHDATDDFPCLRCKALAVRLAPWLDAVRRKAGDERAEQIAQAIEAEAVDYSTRPVAVDRPNTVGHGLGIAARIARESR